MTSKKSFLVNIKTNARRRIWLYVIMFLAFFFSQPVFLAMSLSTETMYYTFDDLGAHLGNVFALCVGLNGGMAFLVAILAVISAVQGFSYMYQRKKLDLYMSVPVSKERRFAAIYINGVLAYLASYLISMMLSFLVAQAMGAQIWRGLGEAAAALIGNTMLFLAVYHITILAVMLTGNLIVTLMGTFVLLFYDGVIYLLTGGYMETFFSSFHYRSTERMADFLISPVIRFFMLTSQAFDFGASYNYYRRVLQWGEFFRGLVPIGFVAVLALGLAYYCYTKKPAEVCGKSMAFPVTKPVIKVCITIPAGLTGGVSFYYLSGQSMLFFLFGMLAGTLLCHSIVEVIYDFDIRSVRNGWKSLLISAVGVAVIFLVFVCDLLGYDSYVPRQEQVDHIAMRFTDSYGTFYNEEFESIGAEQYIFDNMQITDMQPILELATKRMGQIAEVGSQVRYCSIQYTLKNGKNVYRSFPIMYREDTALLDQIVTDPAYQQGSSLVYNEPLLTLGKRLRIYYDDGRGRNVITSEFSLEELWTAYRKDMEDFTYTEMLEELVTGKFEMECVENGMYVSAQLPVYPSFTNTIALIQKTGLYREDYLDMSNVEQIIVRNNNSEAYDKFGHENEYGTYHYIDFSVEATFEDAQEMQQIADAIYPQNFDDFWMPGDTLDRDYDVTVVFKQEPDMTDSDRGSYGNYYMLTDQIPEFVKEATLYREGSETGAVSGETVQPEVYISIDY
ncbi:DUF6449 domain-containing protein [Lachnospiraceae bacterium JLR.KK008]